MVNLVQTTDIPLAGRGYCPRPQGNYAPGEYRRLLNIELTAQGSLKARRPIRFIKTGFDPIRDPRYFIGNWNEWAVFTYTNNKIRAIKLDHDPISGGPGEGLMARPWEGTGGSEGDWIGSSLLYPDLVGAYWAGFHRYNNRNYWIAMQYYAPDIGDASAVCKIFAYNPAGSNQEGNSDNPQDLHASPGGGGSAYPRPDVEVTAFTREIAKFDTPESLGADAQIVGTFIFRDRMWIATQTTLWFSKATDPLTWSVPDGGFFKFPDVKINAVIPCRDSIYILGDSAIWVLNYSSDPNQDAQLSLLSDSLGADSGAVYEDVVYFARYDILYSLENNRVNKVHDLNFNIPDSSKDPEFFDFQLKIVSYYNYLIFVWYDHTLASVTLPTPRSGVSDYSIKYRTKPSTDPDAVRCIWLNMELGSSHEFKFSDQRTVLGDGKMRMGDIFFNTFEDERNKQILYIQSTGNTVSDAPFLQGYNYSIDWDIEDSANGLNNYDIIADTDGFGYNRVPEIDVEIDSVTPDGTEFFMKKFRNLLLEMENSQYPLKLKFGFGDHSGYSTVLDLDNSAPNYANEVRPAYPYRIAINQRARSVTLKLTSADSSLVSVVNTVRLEINRLMLLWSPTGRAPVGQAIE